MSITAYKVEAVGHDRTGKDFGYVNIMYRYGNKQSCPRPDQCEKMEVMWADESVYGPPAPGSKVGDFIQTWLMGSWNCGVFTHREIAQRLMDTFTGLQIKELEWFENPREKALKNGKPRARIAVVNTHYPHFFTSVQSMSVFDRRYTASRMHRPLHPALGQYHAQDRLRPRPYRPRRPRGSCP